MAVVPKAIWFLALMFLFTAPLFYGCEGSKPREQIDDTVKELAGQKKVAQMDKMKKDLGAIQTGQDERMKQFDQAADK